MSCVAKIVPRNKYSSSDRIHVEQRSAAGEHPAINLRQSMTQLRAAWFFVVLFLCSLPIKRSCRKVPSLVQ